MEEIKKIGEFELNKVYCGDCLEFLKKLPDKCVDLCLTDPPYGFLNGVSQIGGFGKIHDKIQWDNKPSKEVFDEIIRVSKNQIIFGGEHLAYLLPCSRGWYVWDKKRSEGLTFSDGELIWTSFDKPVKFIRFLWDGYHRDSKVPIKDKILHPTQKPESIIRTLLNKHSKEGDIILDCFAGSGTTLIACKQLNRNFIGVELLPEYCEIIEKRLKQNNIPNYSDNNQKGGLIK
jgi:site-specific DNA-methyltransferase (adenine-specific)